MELQNYRLETLPYPHEEKDWGEVERWSAELRPSLIVNIPRFSVLLFMDEGSGTLFYVARPSSHGGDVPPPAPFYALQSPSGDSVGIATDEQGLVSYVYFARAGGEALDVAPANDVQLDRLATAPIRKTPSAARVDTPGGEIVLWSNESHCGNFSVLHVRADGVTIADLAPALCHTNPFSAWKEFLVIDIRDPHFAAK